MTSPAGFRTAAEAVIDLSAIRSNTALIKRELGAAALMAVVKADGYGHGAVPVARAAIDAGADMLGVATPPEAVALRAAGITAPVLAWLWPAASDIRTALIGGVALGVAGPAHVAAVAAAAPPGGPLPAVHLVVDTGLSRNGATADDLAALVASAAAAQAAHQLDVVGVMSHLASADVPGDPSVAVQLDAFHRAIDVVEAAGLRPRWRHIANTAATLEGRDPSCTMVRCGIGLYGLPPVPGHDGLKPAMTLRATVALVKRVGAGVGVGYGLTYHTRRPTTLALIPVGYGDGIPRNASNVGQVWLRGRRRTIAGRVAMDQIVVDCGDDPVAAGDEVIVFGPGTAGEPTATDWAGYCDTIDYEIVTRIAPRVPRRYVGAP